LKGIRNADDVHTLDCEDGAAGEEAGGDSHFLRTQRGDGQAGGGSRTAHAEAGEILSDFERDLGNGGYGEGAGEVVERIHGLPGKARRRDDPDGKSGYLATSQRAGNGENTCGGESEDGSPLTC